MPKKTRMQKRRLSKKVGFDPQPLINAAGQITIKRSVLAATGTLTAGSPLLAALQVLGGSGGSFPSLLRAFIQAYDLMYIKSVTIRWVPRWNVNTSVADIPQLIFVANYDDVSTPGTVDFVLGQSGSRMVRFDHEVKLKTNPRLTFQPGGSSSNYALAQASWWNSGIIGTAFVMPLAKYAITSVVTAPGTGTFDVYYDYDIVLRQPVTG